MNALVAYGARLILHRLIMRRSNRQAGRIVGRRRVALQADRVDRGAIQQSRVRSAVREVACSAALGLDNRVLVDKRSGRFRMALGADRIHLRGRAQILPAEGSVRVVAVRALNEAFFHLVMERLVELRLDVGVALEAELRLRYLEQRSRVFCKVNAVAADATYIRFAVSRALEVRMLSLMAGEALRIDFLYRRLCRVEDFGGVATAIYVLLTWSVATLAGNSRFPVLFGELRVRVSRKALSNLFMAGCARLLTNKISRRGRCLAGFRGSLAGSFARCCRRRNGQEAHYEQQREKSGQSPVSSRGRKDRQSHCWPMSMHHEPPQELSWQPSESARPEPAA